VNGVDGRGDAYSVVSYVLGDHLRLRFEGSGVNLRESGLLGLAHHLVGRGRGELASDHEVDRSLTPFTVPVVAGHRYPRPRFILIYINSSRSRGS